MHDRLGTAPAWRAAVWLGALTLGSIGAAAQDAAGGEPPDVIPPNARFGSAALQFGSAQIGFASSPLSPPPGFGVGPAGSAGMDAGEALPFGRPGSTPEPSYLIAAAAEIPAMPPAGAQFGSAPFTLGEAGLTFGSSSAGFGGGATTLGSAASALAVREEAGGALRFTLAADVLFDFDKAVLRRDAGPILAKLMDEVRARVPGGARFTVEGHTDWIGTDAYNDRLSNRRAASVKAWLTRSAGVPGFDVLTIGYGERRPVAPNARPDGSDDPEGRQKNRRVEILVVPR